MERIRTTFISTLACVQFTAFALVRSHGGDSTPTSTVLLYVEILKLASCAAMTVYHKTAGSIFAKPIPVIVPTVLFIVTNVTSYWVITVIPATLYVMLIQLRLPFTMLMSRLCLKKRYSSAQVSAVVFLCIACINVSNGQVAFRKEHETRRRLHFDDTTRSWDAYAVYGVLLEAVIGSVCAVYMERMFDASLEQVWIRNVELSLLSLPFYVATIYYMQYSPIPTQLGMEIAVLGASGGILSALMLTFCGALPKTIVSSLSITFVTVVEHLHYKASPTFEQLSFYAICILAVLSYSLESARSASQQSVENATLTSSSRNMQRVTSVPLLKVTEDDDV